MPIVLSGNVALDMQQQIMSITDLALSTEDLQAEATINGTQILTDPHFAGQLKIVPFNLKYALQNFGQKITTQDPGALQKVGLVTQLQATKNSLQFANAQVTLDNSSITGQANVDANQAITFNLHANQIDADRYLLAIPSSNIKSTKAVTPIATKTITTNNSFTFLRKLNLNGSLTINSFTIAKTVLNNVYVQINAKNGVVKIAPLNAGIYGGKTEGQISIDARNNLTHYTVNETVTNMQISQLFKNSRITGTADATLNVSMQGNDKNSLLSTLNGSTRFSVYNGVFHGIGLFYQLDRAYALLKKQPMSSTADPNNTDFGQLTGSGTFNKGVFNNRDLLMQSPSLKVTGKGTINWVTQALNYHLSAVARQTITNAQGAKINQDRDTSIPLLITGTFDKPVVMPDMIEIAKMLLKQKFKDTGEQIQKALGGKNVSEVFKKKLNNLLH